MKGYKIICHECGKEVLRGREDAKYCEACAKIVRLRMVRERNKRVLVFVSDDTETMRAMCLNCTRPKCIGECEALASLVKEERRGS